MKKQDNEEEEIISLSTSNKNLKIPDETKGINIDDIKLNSNIDKTEGSQTSLDSSNYSDTDYNSQDDNFIVDNVMGLFSKYIVISIIKQLFLWFIFIYFQHFGTFILILISQAYFYKELTKYGIREDKEAKLGWILKGGFRIIYWYWYILASLYVHWKVIEPQLSVNMKQRYNLPTTSKQNADFDFTIFTGYVIGLVIFVLTLRKKHYKYQFERFAYCHVLMFAFCLSCLSITNVFFGLIYFVLPLQLVAMNSSVLKVIYIYSTGRDDTFSYKHTSFLFRLSSLPNFSFFLGWFSTMLGSLLLTRVLINYNLFICPKTDLFPVYWPQQCDYAQFELKPLREFFQYSSVTQLPNWIQELQLCNFDEHAFWFAQFASFLSPFGGYFTATFKRTFKLQTDFGQGPFADRLDCLLLIGVFVYTYINARIAKNYTIDDVYTQIETLSVPHKLEIYQSFGKYLSEHSLLD